MINQILINYIEDFLIFASSYLCSIYIFHKSLNIKTTSLDRLYFLIITILLPNIVIFLRTFSFIYPRVIFLILTCISLIMQRKIKMQTSIFISIISIGISYSCEFISILITSIVFGSFGFTQINSIITLSVIVIQISLVLLLMKIKRFRNGLSIFKYKNNLGISLFVSGFIIFISFLSSREGYADNGIIIVLYICSIISSIGLFLWIRKSITEHYRKKLQDKAEEHYQNTLAEKERYIEQLANSNTYLSKVVHRDNHLMSSLQYSIEQFKNCDDENEKDKILNEILTLANERGDLLLKEQKSNNLLAGTGSPIIDGALGNMYVKAVAHNIDFNLVVNEEVHYLINNIISQTDLETLLCDHIKDAIIAIEADDDIAGKILVTIEMVDNIYEISIKDNGVDFDVDTLAKLGLERVTTHKDSGGSGIGFMTTFETLNKTNASLIIIEYENKIPFSKSITFRFDGLKSFIIKSYRSDELKEAINRDDMIII